MKRLLFSAAIMLGLNIAPAAAETPALRVLAKIGPCPAVSALIAYRGRI